MALKLTKQPGFTYLAVEVMCMCEALLGVIVACLAVFGLIEVLRIILMPFLNPQDSKEGFIILVPACGHDEEIEMTLRSLVADVRWRFAGKPWRVICLDLGMDTETRKICEIFSEEYAFIELHSLRTFNKAIEQAAAFTR